MKFREVNMKQYIDPKNYLASNEYLVLKIVRKCQLIRINVILRRVFCEIDINHAKSYGYVFNQAKYFCGVLPF